jgi:DHA1 family bicyclomycin/chloramphenicol resistance-like MFS transporter
VSEKLERFPMSRYEFIGLIAMMFATIAFSIDAMLPALPEIATDLTPGHANRAGLILTSFVLGMGIGTFVAGPLSDAFGRRKILFLGSGLYIIAATVAWASSTLEVMLIARVVQGFGAAGPRIVAVAIVRDLYAGREMARIVSFVMLVFTLVPAFAPALGAFIVMGFGWRAIFVAFIIFSLITVVWLAFRLPETLDQEDRRPFKIKPMAAAVKEIFAHPLVRLSIYVQTLAMGMLFLTLMLIQPVYADVFGRAASFPYWTGFIAILAGSASLVNAMFVMRVGMQRLVKMTLGVQAIIAVIGLAIAPAMLPDPYGFAIFLFWQVCIFFQAGLTLGNLNAIAMEPMGHIAGMAASVIGAFSTVTAAVIASAITQIFPPTVNCLLASVLVMAGIGYFIMRHMANVTRQMAPAE